ncbi:hypothetical protein JL720_12286 [Aureococcus anophagefferens]|nr:hypothetical protein JL720_12286 [Aureococcus anophagefferens]
MPRLRRRRRLPGPGRLRQRHGRALAFASVFDAHVKLPLTSRKGPGLLEHEAKVARVARRNGADRVVVLPVPGRQRVPVANATIAALDDLGIEIRYSEHVVPPKLSAGIKVESGGCCGAREFLKLEPMGYGEYDAMIVMDLDYDPEDTADFGPLFDCVAEGRVLTTRGPEVPVNGAFLAARMQGFFHWFFYRSRASDAAADAGAGRPAQVDPCVWNLQKGFADLCMRELCYGHARAFSHLQHPHERVDAAGRSASLACPSACDARCTARREHHTM